MPHPSIAPLTQDNRHPQDSHLRWNPLFGTYVDVKTAEQDLLTQIQEENLAAHQRALEKVRKREGDLDPIFWRDRQTGEQNRKWVKTIPAKRPVEKMCYNIVTNQNTNKGQWKEGASFDIIPAHAKDEVGEILHSDYSNMVWEEEEEEVEGIEEKAEGQFTEGEKEIIIEEEQQQKEPEGRGKVKSKHQRYRNRVLPFVKTGIDGLPLSPKRDRGIIVDHRNRDHVNVLLHDEMREKISNQETVTFDCTSKSLRKRPAKHHIDHVKSLIHQIKNTNIASTTSVQDFQDLGETPYRFKKMVPLGSRSRQGTVSTLLHVDECAPLPPDQYFYDEHGNRHHVSAVEVEMEQEKRRWLQGDKEGEEEVIGAGGAGHSSVSLEKIHNPAQYDNHNATKINGNYLSARKERERQIEKEKEYQQQQQMAIAAAKEGKEGLKSVLFYDAPPARKNEQVAGIVNRIPIRGKSNKPDQVTFTIPTSTSVTKGFEDGNSNINGLKTTSDHVIFGGQGSSNMKETYSAKQSIRRVMNECKVDSSKDWYGNYDDKMKMAPNSNYRTTATQKNNNNESDSRPLPSTSVTVPMSSMSYMKSVGSQNLADSRLMYEKSLDPNAQIHIGNVVGKFDRHEGITEVGGHDNINFDDKGVTSVERKPQLGIVDPKTGYTTGRFDRHDGGILEVGGHQHIHLTDDVDPEKATFVREKNENGSLISRYDRNDGSILEVGGTDQIVLEDSMGTNTNLKNAENAKLYVQERPTYMDHDQNYAQIEKERATHKAIVTPRPAWLDHESCTPKCSE